MQCNMGETVEYLDINGTKKYINCTLSIDNFINYMNQNIYGMNWESPFYGSSLNGSWCKLNVTKTKVLKNCPSHSQQGGYLSVFKLDAYRIKICSNLGNSSGSTKYMETTVSYE